MRNHAPLIVYAATAVVFAVLTHQCQPIVMRADIDALDQRVRALETANN